MQITETQIAQVNKQIKALLSTKFLWKEIRRSRRYQHPVC